MDNNIFSGNTGNFQNRNTIQISSAVIEEIARERDVTFITVSYEDCINCDRREGRVQLAIDRNTAVINEQGRNIRANELERGMVIDAIYSARMTRSIPPQAQAYFIQVIRRAGRTNTTTGRIIEVNRRGNYILILRNQNPASAIRLNISPETVIRDIFGRRTDISALRPGFRVRAEHASFMTASIPPQTTAYTIQIIR